MLISGNEIADGLEKEDCGIFAVKSSSILARREKAGRTGYSWSVMITPAEGERVKNLLCRKPQYVKANQQAVLHLPCCIRAQYSYSLGYSDAYPEQCVLRPSL